MVSKQLLSNIHAKFRSLRNGEVADLLCQHGVHYHLAFGVQSYQLKGIAEKVKMENPEIFADEHSAAELAETLWNEDIRESKMLATRLYPISVMEKETAIRWSQEAPFHEITDQLVMHLLSRLSYIDEIIDQMPEYTRKMIEKRRDS